MRNETVNQIVERACRIPFEEAIDALKRKRKKEIRKNGKTDFAAKLKSAIKVVKKMKADEDALYTCPICTGGRLSIDECNEILAGWNDDFEVFQNHNNDVIVYSHSLRKSTTWWTMPHNEREIKARIENVFGQ